MHVLFPGSFDPPHLGHADLIARAASLFTRLTVAVAINPDKKPFLPLARRLDLLRAIVAPHANVDVASYDGSTAAFARGRGCG
ncbi:MAG: adenylyltransferase/cytidyltransferase family protein, partial [Planctomycetes bacterium]|nr:adenylyltransferase/cytidyltransferase family protein [Planctomycetota bacterium]